jgi:hypothetical protein
MVEISHARAWGSLGRKALPDVVAVARGVLADEEQFVSAVVEEFAALGDDAVERLAAHLPADAGDRAERAVLVAPLRDPQVRVVPRRQAEPGRIVLEIPDPLPVLPLHGQPNGLEPAVLRGGQRVPGDPVFRGVVGEPTGLNPWASDHGIHRLHDLVPIKHADHRVDPRGPLQHLGPVPLHEAPGDDDAADLPPLLGSDGFLDDPERFVL